MEYMDEKIISMLYKTEMPEKSAENEQELDLQNVEFTIDGEKVTFKSLSLLDGTIEMVVPKSFTIMTEEDARLKYPSERRPPIIYTNEVTSITVTLNPTTYEVEEDEIEEFKNTMLAIVKRSQPAARWIADGMVIISGHRVGYFQYVTPALDCNLYLYQLFAELEGRVVLITFSCMEEEMDSWVPIAKMMMESMKWKSKGEGEKVDE